MSNNFKPSLAAVQYLPDEAKAFVLIFLMQEARRSPEFCEVLKAAILKAAEAERERVDRLCAEEEERNRLALEDVPW